MFIVGFSSLPKLFMTHGCFGVERKTKGLTETMLAIALIISIYLQCP